MARQVKAKLELPITPAMLAAGVAAYEDWDRFADRPLEGKNRAWLTKQEKERLTSEVMVLEIVSALFGNASVVVAGA